MSKANREKPHVYVIPEDKAERQIAIGFEGHYSVINRQLQVMPVADGWRNVGKVFEKEYLPILRRYEFAHVVMLIDFDGEGEHHRNELFEAVPSEYRNRVFVVGPSQEPEDLKGATKQTYEQIGFALANDCDGNQTAMWGHEQLKHNDDQRKLLLEIVKPFLFK